MSQTDSPLSASRTRMNPQEEALSSLCKQILKSHIFQGHFVERRYVESVLGYRDIVALQSNERDLKKLLLDVCSKLTLFYQHTPDRRMWIGVTQHKLLDAAIPAGACDICIWTEFEDVAFGQYWFIIKNVRFRDNEILLKLKVVRPIDSVPNENIQSLYQTKTAICANDEDEAEPVQRNAEPQIGLEEFAAIVRGWGTNIKRSVYEFMRHDVSKENIRSFFQFVGLLIISLVSGAIVTIRYLGAFTIRFMFEFSRLTHTLTPLLLKVIETVNKIIGGFYILIAMIWKDLIGHRFQAKQAANIPAIEYKRPIGWRMHIARQNYINSPSGADNLRRNDYL